jgi:hypothetical protein
MYNNNNNKADPRGITGTHAGQKGQKKRKNSQRSKSARFGVMHAS